MTEAPTTITYASVVSRELVHIALTLAALNGFGGEDHQHRKCLPHCSGQ